MFWPLLAMLRLAHQPTPLALLALGIGLVTFMLSRLMLKDEERHRTHPPTTGVLAPRSEPNRGTPGNRLTRSTVRRGRLIGRRDSFDAGEQ
jgi:hypothetical protein